MFFVSVWFRLFSRNVLIAQIALPACRMCLSAKQASTSGGFQVMLLSLLSTSAWADSLCCHPSSGEKWVYLQSYIPSKHSHFPVNHDYGRKSKLLWNEIQHNFYLKKLKSWLKIHGKYKHPSNCQEPHIFWTSQFPSSSAAAKHWLPTRLHQLQVSFGHKYRLAVLRPKRF